jgi:hypothetical protein
MASTDCANDGSDGGRCSVGNNFIDSAQGSPCEGCSAPCCRLLLIPHPVPKTFMDLDYLRYMLGFPELRLLISANGEWQVMLERTCTLLDPVTSRCTVHGTPRKPKTCVFFNPYRCWYKRNFGNGHGPIDAVRLDGEAFELLLQGVTFDEEQNIAGIPSWDELKELVKPTEHGGSRVAQPRVGAMPGETGPLAGTLQQSNEPWRRTYLVPLDGARRNRNGAGAPFAVVGGEGR